MHSSFNDLTQLAAVICGAPASVLMLTTDDVMYCKSTAGILIEDVEKNLSLFTHSQTNATDYECILNIYKDERFHALNLKDEFPELTSYHSYRIITKSGRHIGVIAILCDKDKELSKLQINGLRLIGKQVAKLIKLQRKNTALKTCRKHLQKVSNNADAFAAMAAHDLKAPIRNVKSFVELIKSEKKWNEEDTMYFEFIDKSILKMNLLIDGLMDLTKTKSNEKPLEAVDLDVLVSNAFHESVKSVHINTVSLNKDNLSVIYSHTVLLSTVVENLINNAIKYQENHPIEVSVSYKAESGFHILTISDNGIGMDATHFNDIFKPFKRLHTHSEYEGSGLGLATCKRIVKYLKGSISVESQLQQGSTFTIKLPIIEKV